MARAPEAGHAQRITASQRTLAAFFIAAGVNHFVIPRAYEGIVPPSLWRHRRRVVQASGIAEIAGGAAVLAPRTRSVAGWWLIAVLAAVFPANLYMAREPARFPRIPPAALYARLALQPLMAWWAWRATRA